MRNSSGKVGSAPPSNREFRRLYEQQQRERDAKRAAEAEKKFKEKVDLNDTIKKVILPSIVRIESAHGTTGMGFFQHSQWLVSNAHVIKHRSDIDDGIVLIDSESNAIGLEAEQAYHRPYDNVESPDIVVLKTDSRQSDKHSAIPTDFSGSTSSASDTYYFYIDADLNIRYITPVPGLSGLPLKFSCNDKKFPQPGCSGTPVIAAKLTDEGNIEWEFKTVGALYAVCKSPGSQQEKHVCVVPVSQDFQQIYSILTKKGSSNRHGEMSHASMIIGDEQQAKAHQLEEQKLRKLAENKIKRFEAGDSILDISLPDGLEKLAYNDIVSLSKSYLIKLKILKPDEIEPSYNNFLELIGNESEIKLVIFGTDTPLRSNTHWRVDCRNGGENKEYWLLQIQDNTGRDLKDGSKSGSSVFGEVKVPKEIKCVNGRALAEAFRTSQKNAKEKEDLKSNGNQKKANTIVVSIIVGTPEHPVERYQVKEQPKVMTPRTLRLFEVVNEKESYKVLNNTLLKFKKESVDRINAVNLSGDTPLMVILKDEKLNEKPGQLAKAKLLIQYGALWDQPNKDNLTAGQILEEHTGLAYLKKVKKLQ